MAVALLSEVAPPSDLPSNVVARHRDPPPSQPSGSILYTWLQGQLTEIMADPTLPQTVRQDLTRVRSEMDISIPTTEKLNFIATDPTMAMMVHQPLARMALDERVMYYAREPLAEMTMDIHLIFSTQSQLGLVLNDGNLTPELSSRISAITANHEFFAAVMRGIAGRANHEGFTDSDRAILRALAQDASLLSLAQPPEAQNTPTGPGQDQRTLA
eukprot:1713964-Rhodomonas_salina.1